MEEQHALRAHAPAASCAKLNPSPCRSSNEARKATRYVIWRARPRNGATLRVLGINAVFHDPAAALVVDSVTVAAAEEERFSRRKHGKSPVLFSTWEVLAAQKLPHSLGLMYEELTEHLGIQTVDQHEEPLVGRMLEAFEERTGLPVIVNTSLNIAGRPMVDDPRDALECFGSAPVDALAMGPYLVRRQVLARGIPA